MNNVWYTKNMNKGNVSNINFNNSIIKKEKMKKKYYDRSKTQFCKSLTTFGYKCVYKDKCNYAHSIDELRIRMCNYPDTCYKVYVNDKGYFRNCENQKCSFLHSEETKQNYVKRLGIYYNEPVKEMYMKKIDVNKRENEEIEKVIELSKQEQEKIKQEKEELEKVIEMSKQDYEKREQDEIDHINELFEKLILEESEEKYGYESEEESEKDIEIILDNPEILKKIWERKKYYRTQYCNKKDCKNKKDCDFAHSKEELRICKCSYFQTCIHIGRGVNGECYNETSKICKFLHWGETKKEYFSRIEM